MDDEEDMLFVLTQSFEGLGYQYETAMSGEEALEKIPDFDPDVIFTDFNMTGMNGLDLAKESKHIKPDVKVFLHTGNDKIKSEDRKYFHKIFLKPVLSLELIKALKELG